jgi:hypothetical protein
MDREAVQARISRETAELQVQFPQVTGCQAALVQWKDGAAARYALHLDIRWPQHQTLMSGGPHDSAETAIVAAFQAARARLRDALAGG